MYSNIQVFKNSKIKKCTNSKFYKFSILKIINSKNRKHSNTKKLIHKNKFSGSAFIDLVIKYGWVSVTILYENNESMMRLKEIYTHTSKVKIIISFKNMYI